MKTYRYSGHSRSDPATYRPPGELDAWLGRDPLEIHGVRLIEAGAATPASLDRIRAEVDASVALAVRAARAAPERGVDAMFRHVHADSHRM